MVNKEPSQRAADAKSRSAALKRRATGFSLGVLLAAFGIVATGGTPGGGANPVADPLAIAALPRPSGGATPGTPAAPVPAVDPQGSATGARPAPTQSASSLARPGRSVARPAAPVRRARSRMS